MNGAVDLRLEPEGPALYNLKMGRFHFLPLGIAGLVAWGLTFVACQPVSFAVVDAAASLDAWGQDSSGVDHPPVDSARTDAASRDRRINPNLDGGSRDLAIGPRVDAGGLRDVNGIDLSIGPRIDAAGTDLSTPTPGSQSCVQWQDCAPHYADPFSGYQCVEGYCVCDPDSSMMTQCTTGGGQWLGQECFCVTNATGMPGSDAGDNCWWSWEQDSCEPDRWVDTSYQREDCYCCDSNGDEICDWIWVDDGYWEDGYCPPGEWVENCY